MRCLSGCIQYSNITLVVSSPEFQAHHSKRLLVMNYLQGAKEVKTVYDNLENIGHLLLCWCSVLSVKYSLEMLREKVSKIAVRSFPLFLFRDTDKNNHLDNEIKPKEL